MDNVHVFRTKTDVASTFPVRDNGTHGHPKLQRRAEELLGMSTRRGVPTRQMLRQQRGLPEGSPQATHEGMQETRERPQETHGRVE